MNGRRAATTIDVTPPLTAEDSIALLPGTHTAASAQKDSRTTTGLLDEDQPMTRSIAAPVHVADAADRSILETERGIHHWRVASSHPHLLNASAVDWFALSESPDCSLVKRNSQRDVWKIRAAGRDYFAKL
ncbi:MAG TPA: hypothetical protein VMV81_08245, partial [Phycisphaerae bacterium]|nr:hypothetical protein [Phycisphaerae bacterium]